MYTHGYTNKRIVATTGKLHVKDYVCEKSVGASRYFLDYKGCSMILRVASLSGYVFTHLSYFLKYSDLTNYHYSYFYKCFNHAHYQYTYFYKCFNHTHYQYNYLYKCFDYTHYSAVISKIVLRATILIIPLAY